MAVSTGMGAFQEYQDAAYQQAQRNIAPQQEAQQRKFEQSMLNKGITAGSKAYNLAQAQMQRGQNDQNNAANFQAMQFGQQAQAQEFGQDYQNRTMAMQKDQFGRSLAQNQNQFLTSMNEQGRQFDVGMSQRESEFGRNFSNMQGQQDFSNLLGLGQFAMGMGNFYNQGIQQDYNMAQTQLGMAPNQQANQLDVQGAYNSAMTGANNVYQGQMGAYNSMVGALSNVAGAAMMPSGLEFKIMQGKTKQTKRERIAAEMLAMPIYEWHYKPEFAEHGDKIRTGVLADDFNARVSGMDGELTIDIQRYTAALHLTIQELFYECRRLENMLWHVAEARGIPLDARAFQGSKGMGKVFDITERIDETPEHWVDIKEAA